jgi:branched-chain amino acid transport system permease protein
LIFEKTVGLLFFYFLTSFISEREMDFFISLVIAGACVGSVYALVAVGLNMTFWTTKTLNFGQGAVMMLCAMSTALLVQYGFSDIVSIVFGLSLVALIGVLVERIAIRPALKTAGSMGWVIATLGFGIVIQGITARYFGSQAVAFPEVLFQVQDVVTIWDQSVSLQYLAVLCISLLLIIILEVLTRYTVLGTSIQATAQDIELAVVQGLPVNLIVSGSFVISSVLAGVAGILVAQISGTVDPAFGFELVLFGFVAAVLGGMGSSGGALLGGIILGITSKLVGGYISTAAEHGIAFALLILMLAIRPQGFFGRVEVNKA